VVVDVAEYEHLQRFDRVQAPSFAELLLAMPQDGGEFPRLSVRPRDLSAAIGNDSTDLMIAGTALEHGLTVVTRNVSDFEPTGVPVLNPFNRRPRRES